MIVIFEIFEENNLQDHQVEELIKNSPLYVFCKEWKWRRGANFDNIIIPELPEEGPGEESVVSDIPQE